MQWERTFRGKARSRARSVFEVAKVEWRRGARAVGGGERGESRRSQVERTSGGGPRGLTQERKRGREALHTRSNILYPHVIHYSSPNCVLQSDLKSLRVRRLALDLSQTKSLMSPQKQETSDRFHFALNVKDERACKCEINRAVSVMGRRGEKCEK